MKGMIRDYEVDELFWSKSIDVDPWVRSYWGRYWMEEVKGPEWEKGYKGPQLVAGKKFSAVWSKKFELKLRAAQVIPPDEACELCPERFRGKYFNGSLLHKVVDVDGQRFLIQVDSYCDCPYVDRMWLLPR